QGDWSSDVCSSDLGGNALEAAVDDVVHDLGVELLGERRETRHIGKQDGDLLAFTFQGTPGGQNLLGQMFRRIGQREALGRLDGRGRWRGCRASITCPEQPSALVLTHLRIRVEEFVLKILEGGVIELKLPLE